MVIHTFVVEAVYPVDARALVVATQQEEVLRVLNLVRQQQADRLQRLLPSAYILIHSSEKLRLAT
jgi:hypothetical protein